MLKRNGILVALFVFGFFVLFSLNKQIKSRQHTLQVKIKECDHLLQQVQVKQQHLQQTRKSLDYLFQDLDDYEQWQNQQINWSDLLQQTMNELPKRLWLEKLTAHCDLGNTRFQNIKYMNRRDLYNTTYDLILYGKSTRRESVGKFVAGLEGTGRLKESAIAEVDKQDAYWRFKIQSTLK